MDAASTSITVRVNGRPAAVPGGSTVADLLRRLEIAAPLTAVEVNREVVPRGRHGETLLRDGDAVEVVQFVGGG